MKLINLMVGALAITRAGASAGRSNNTDACEIKHLKNIESAGTFDVVHCADNLWHGDPDHQALPCVTTDQVWEACNNPLNLTQEYPSRLELENRMQLKNGDGTCPVKSNITMLDVYNAATSSFSDHYCDPVKFPSTLARDCAIYKPLVPHECRETSRLVAFCNYLENEFERIYNRSFSWHDVYLNNTIPSCNLTLVPRSPRASDIHFPSPSPVSSEGIPSSSRGSQSSSTSQASKSVSSSSNRASLRGSTSAASESVNSSSTAGSRHASSSGHDSSVWLSPASSEGRPSSSRGFEGSSTSQVSESVISSSTAGSSHASSSGHDSNTWVSPASSEGRPSSSRGFQVSSTSEVSGSVSPSSGSNLQHGSNSWLSPSVSPLSSRGSQSDSDEASSADHNSGAWLSSSLPSSAVVVHSRPRMSSSFRDTDPHVTPSWFWSPPDDGHGDPEQTGHGVPEQTYEIIRGVCYGVIALGVTSLFFLLYWFYKPRQNEISIRPMYRTPVEGGQQPVANSNEEMAGVKLELPVIKKKKLTTSLRGVVNEYYATEDMAEKIECLNQIYQFKVTELADKTQLEIDKVFICPINFEVIGENDLTMLPNGTFVSREGIEGWLAIKNTCPFTRLPLNKNDLPTVYKSKVLEHIKTIKDRNSSMMGERKMDLFLREAEEEIKI